MEAANIMNPTSSDDELNILGTHKGKATMLGTKTWKTLEKKIVRINVEGYGCGLIPCLMVKIPVRVSVYI